MSIPARKESNHPFLYYNFSVYIHAVTLQNRGRCIRKKTFKSMFHSQQMPKLDTDFAPLSELAIFWAPSVFSIYAFLTFRVCADLPSVQSRIQLAVIARTCIEVQKACVLFYGVKDGGVFPFLSLLEPKHYQPLYQVHSFFSA